MILTVGAFAAFAADGLSGEFSATITVDPLACAYCYYDYGLITLGAALTVDYALDVWTFGAVSTFDDSGFSSQKFTVAGLLGAFTIASSMTFDPMAVTVWTWPTITHGYATDVLCSTWCPEATTWGPRFLEWDVTMGVSIAGITVEVYVLQDYSSYAVTNVNYAYQLNTQEPYVQTDSYTCEGTNGMGWRLKVAGSFGSVDVTSYTYFNLSEADSREIHCPAIGKRGVFTVGAGCDFGFNEEYLLLEGFAFGCASVDVGLKILCTGFDSIEFLISDISIGGFMTMDFKLGFTVATKSYDFCISLDALTVDCFIVELGFGSSGYVTSTVIDNITVNGVGFEYTWNGIAFKSYTEFTIASDLISPESGVSGAEKWSYIDGCSYFSIDVPFLGSDCGTCVDVPDVCEDTTEYVCVGLDDEFYELKCQVADRYKVWEKFVIDVDADACCGGLFDLTFTTLFGDYEKVGAWQWTAYEYVAGAWAAYGLTDSAVIVAGTALPANSAPTSAPSASGHCNTEAVDFDIAWVGGQTTLFNWAKTTVDLGVGIASNITLTLGFDISACST